jgi:hypothetical protein
MRAWLAGFIVLATIGFVIGTSIERHNSTHESAAQLRAEGAASHAPEPGGESAATRAAETARSTKSETHKELRPLGVNIEAVPFIVLAALASLALAALGYTRPRWLLGLGAIASAMVVLGALDVREAFHQSDESRTGLVILAAVIAALHFAAAGTAGVMAARRSAPGSPEAAGTIPV